VIETAADLVSRYAAGGFAVLPLHGKVPRIPLAHPKGDPLRSACKGECGRPGHGVWDATTDLGTISEWFARWPDTNWGMAVPPGYVVIDVDPRNGGATSWANLEAKHGRLPPTLTAHTGGDGWHYWFHCDGPSRGKIAEGVDVKKHGGYVVAPPSLHASGRRYEWTRVAAIPYAPLWVRRLLNPPPPPRQPVQPRTGSDSDGLDGLIRSVLDAPEGQRNSILYWAACRAHEGHHDVTPLIRAAIDIGLPHREAEATCESAQHSPARTTTTPLTRRGTRL
jgi:hypothetical protein